MKKTTRATVAMDGNLVRTRRTLMGYTAALLAQKVGITERHMGSIERGETRVGPKVFGRLCDVLGVAPDRREAFVDDRDAA